MFVAVGEDGPCSFAATHSTYFFVVTFFADRLVTSILAFATYVTSFTA